MSKSKALDLLKNSKSNFKVTGLCFQYLYICERELWFYMKGVNQDQDNVYLTEGRILDSKSYGGSDNYFIDSTISIDISENGKIIETKNSSKLEEASKMQVSYYLWYLEEFHNINDLEGIIKYPKEDKSVSIILDDELRDRVVEDIENIYEIYRKDNPPEYEEKPFCNNCSFHDFCLIGGNYE